MEGQSTMSEEEENEGEMWGGEAKTGCSLLARAPLLPSTIGLVEPFCFVGHLELY